ncbi:hypothetical protein N7516_009516 [Penicillium verrucosum]|uniref:uncharacterized protein n=1 Tax=Penicillium verrucosum TaxID=60171 RepID=UPI002544D963|nr:uncharacterized protein N7516_009516 [Penicillium verrucosum]KAJ5921813.1 hypothetical protein N7516_009516 [Penicillium verrucosum]
MMDDLSMHFATTPVLYRVLTANSNRRDSAVMGMVLGAVLVFLVTFHVMTDELLVHSVSFPDAAGLSYPTTDLGNTIFNLGYWLWIVDQWACGFLTKAREAIGLPYAFILELHGWWHICTGIGAYTFVAVVDHLVSGENLSQQSFAWPASWASTSIFAGREPVDKVNEKQK